MKSVTLRTTLLILFGLVPFAGCGGEDVAVSGASESCAPGESETCDCADGSRGSARCSADGALGECSCSDARTGTSSEGRVRGMSCGNDTLDSGEACDGSNFNGETCSSLTMGALPAGTLSCTASCIIDVSGCTSSNTGGTTGAGGATASGGTVAAGGTVGEGGSGP